MKLIFCLALGLFPAVLTYGQIGGNQVFRNRHNEQYGTPPPMQPTKLYLSDSTFLIEAKVLKNVPADFYIAVFGLNEQATSVAGSNSQINKRIGNFTRNLKKAGIRDTDIYTDIITQHRVYDLKGNQKGHYEEYLKGFSLSKNVIVKYYKSAQIEQMLLVAAQDSIFDLVKVDYMVADISKVYNDLFAAATEVIKKKREHYLNLTGAKLKPSAQIYGEDFITYYPAEMYKSYTAAASNYFESYDWLQHYTVKRLHKPQTFYYDKLSYSGFDKVIDPAVLEPALEFGLTLQVKYERSDK